MIMHGSDTHSLINLKGARQCVWEWPNLKMQHWICKLINYLALSKIKETCAIMICQNIGWWGNVNNGNCIHFCNGSGLNPVRICYLLYHTMESGAGNTQMSPLTANLSCRFPFDPKATGWRAKTSIWKRGHIINQNVPK